MSLHTRRTAVEILTQAEMHGAHTNELLRRVGSRRGVHAGLLQALVRGTLQWRGTADQVLSEELGNPFSSYSSEAKNILRVCAYQILMMKDLALPLVTSETKALLQEFRAPLSSPKVAALIRALIRLRKQGSREPAADADLAVNFPPWLISRWQEQFGARECTELCRAYNRPWPTTIHINRLKASPRIAQKFLKREGVRVRQHPLAEHCFEIESLPRGVRLDALESFERGLFFVQDPSSALVGALLDPQPGEYLVDLCAAPGGKSCDAALRMANKGKVLACDLYQEKLNRVQENTRRLGISIVTRRCVDALQLTLSRPADCVLLDAPCSGLGVLGRKADLRWAKSFKQIEELVLLQQKLIAHAATLVKPGGRLVYSTCTIEPLENEQIVEKFLKEHPAFSLIDPSDRLPKSVVTKGRYMHTFPHRHSMAGAFAALLHRAAD